VNKPNFDANKVKILSDFRRIAHDKAHKVNEKDIACKNCRFHVEQRTSPDAITKSLVCRYGPPAMSMIPTNAGLVVNSQFPLVQPDFWCYQFEPPDL